MCVLVIDTTDCSRSNFGSSAAKVQFDVGSSTVTSALKSLPVLLVAVAVAVVVITLDDDNEDLAIPEGTKVVVPQ